MYISTLYLKPFIHYEETQSEPQMSQMQRRGLYWKVTQLLLAFWISWFWFSTRTPAVIGAGAPPASVCAALCPPDWRTTDITPCAVTLRSESSACSWAAASLRRPMNKNSAAWTAAMGGVRRSRGIQSNVITLKEAVDLKESQKETT